MSDDTPNGFDKVARNSVFTIIGHGAATLSLGAIIWLATSVTTLQREVVELRVEMAKGTLPRIEALEDRVLRTEQELDRQSDDRFSKAEAAQMEARLRREIQRMGNNLLPFERRPRD